MHCMATESKQESAGIFADACSLLVVGGFNHLPVANQPLVKTNVLSFVNPAISTLLYQQDTDEGQC